jgi:uncharacterized membrane protein
MAAHSPDDLSNMRRPTSLVPALVFCLIAAYPVLVLLGLQHAKPGMMGALLLFSLLWQAKTNGKSNSKAQQLMLLLSALYTVVLIIKDSELLLRFYPVVVNSGVGVFFLLSLRNESPALTSYAKRFGMEIPEHAKNYLHKLTLLWGLLLICNAVFSAYTALFFDLRSWALYNGFIVYLLFGAIFLLEFIFRQFYKKRAIQREQRGVKIN